MLDIIKFFPIFAAEKHDALTRRLKRRSKFLILNKYTIMIRASYIALVALTILLDIWALFTLFKKREKGCLWWAIIILALPTLGAIAYFQLERFKRK